MAKGSTTGGTATTATHAAAVKPTFGAVPSKKVKKEKKKKRTRA